MRFFISAGEASGDLHGSHLIDAIRRERPDAEFVFLGGDKMATSAGTAPLIHYRDMAYMGFVEVLKNIGKVMHNLSAAKRAIAELHPDALVLIDYPSFNLRIARHAKKLDIPVYYYIPPKVWAWKERRVKKMRRYVDHVLSILPFEEEWYRTRHGMEITYVGNPTANEVESQMRLARQSEMKSQTAVAMPIIALVPGSRKAEIRSNLPVMVEVARRHPEFRPVIASAPGIDDEEYAAYGDIERVTDTFALMHRCEAAMVTSGTATLEAAVIGTPQVVCYRNNGSRLVYNLFKHILKIKYVSLPNLIVDNEIVAEKLLHHCNVDEVDAALTPLLSDTPERNVQQAGYADLRHRLTSRNASAEAARIITGAKC